MFDVPAEVSGRPPGGEVPIGEGGGLQVGPAMVSVGSLSCGVLEVDPGGVGCCLLGQGVSFSVAWDASMGSDFVEVGDSPMTYPLAEDHLQGL